MDRQQKMKEALTIGIVLASFSYCVFGQGIDAGPRPAAEEEIARSIAEINTAYVSRKAEPFEKLYLDNYVNIRGRPYYNTREQLIAMMKADGAELHSGKKLDFETISYEANPVRIKVSGSAAVVAATKQNTWSYKGVKCPTRHQNTELWVKRSGTWRILASQSATFPCSPPVWNPPHSAVLSVPNQTRPPRSPDVDAELGLILAFNRLRAAASEGASEIGKLIPDDFLWTDSSGALAADKAAFASLLAAKIDRGIAARREELFYAESDAGFATFRALQRTHSPPTTSEELVQLTVFFVRLNGEWRAVAAQATSVAGDTNSQGS